MSNGTISPKMLGFIFNSLEHESVKKLDFKLKRIEEEDTEEGFDVFNIVKYEKKRNGKIVLQFNKEAFEKKLKEVEGNYKKHAAVFFQMKGQEVNFNYLDLAGHVPFGEPLLRFPIRDIFEKNDFENGEILFDNISVKSLLDLAKEGYKLNQISQSLGKEIKEAYSKSFSNQSFLETISIISTLKGLEKIKERRDFYQFTVARPQLLIQALPYVLKNVCKREIATLSRSHLKAFKEGKRVLTPEEIRKVEYTLEKLSSLRCNYPKELASLFPDGYLPLLEYIFTRVASRSFLYEFDWAKQWLIHEKEIFQKIPLPSAKDKNENKKAYPLLFFLGPALFSGMWDPALVIFNKVKQTVGGNVNLQKQNHFFYKTIEWDKSPYQIAKSFEEEFKCFDKIKLPFNFLTEEEIDLFAKCLLIVDGLTITDKSREALLFSPEAEKKKVNFNDKKIEQIEHFGENFFMKHFKLLEEKVESATKEELKEWVENGVFRAFVFDNLSNFQINKEELCGFEGQTSLVRRLSFLKKKREVFYTSKEFSISKMISNRLYKCDGYKALKTIYQNARVGALPQITESEVVLFNNLLIDVPELKQKIDQLESCQTEWERLVLVNEIFSFKIKLHIHESMKKTYEGKVDTIINYGNYLWLNHVNDYHFSAFKGEVKMNTLSLEEQLNDWRRHNEKLSNKFILDDKMGSFLKTYPKYFRTIYDNRFVNRIFETDYGVNKLSLNFIESKINDDYILNLAHPFYWIARFQENVIENESEKLDFNNIHLLKAFSNKTINERIKDVYINYIDKLFLKKHVNDNEKDKLERINSFTFHLMAVYQAGMDWHKTYHSLIRRKGLSSSNVLNQPDLRKKEDWLDAKILEFNHFSEKKESWRPVDDIPF